MVKQSRCSFYYNILPLLWFYKNGEGLPSALKELELDRADRHVHKYLPQTPSCHETLSVFF